MKKVLIICLAILNFTNVANAQISLYGITKGSDPKIIQYDVASNSLSVEHQFQAPTLPWYNSLIQAKNGKLYGMAKSGGTTGYGVLFTFDPTTRAYLPLYHFDGASGRSSYGSLVQASNGKLYGLTEGGGSLDRGTVFSFDIETNTYSKLHEFDGQNGRSPYGSLVQASNGKLYGLTEGGGSLDRGTVFSFDIETNTYSKLHEFDGQNGRSPYGSLVQASNGLLYGMTQFGGTNRYGTIFSLNPVTDAITANKHSFNWADGAWPNSSLVESNGRLYGMTESGGANYGVIFEFDPASGVITKVENFTNANGRSPYGSLVNASNGELFGLAYRGGLHDLGVLFSINPTGFDVTKLKDFDGSNGANPAAALLEVRPLNNIPLPLKILSYNVKAVNGKVTLELVVDKETDVEKYEVQRSRDGINFTSIVYATAKNENKKTQYIFYDDQPLDINHYRIKINERNSASFFTTVKKVDFGKGAFTIQLKSNPVVNDIHIQANLLQKEQLAFRLIDAHGRLLKAWDSKTFEPGQHHIQLHMQNSERGTYFLEVKSVTQKQVLKLVR